MTNKQFELSPTDSVMNDKPTKRVEIAIRVPSIKFQTNYRKCSKNDDNNCQKKLKLH